jgi:hypothetical protein
MSDPAEKALNLQRPLPDGELTIVARGDRKDRWSPRTATDERNLTAQEVSPPEAAPPSAARRRVRRRAQLRGKRH